MSPREESLLTLQDTTTTGSNWSAVRSALVADALRGCGHLRLRVNGESMLPTLWPGAVVEIEGCSPEDVRPGEIVLALREDRLVLHRLVSAWTSNGFVLRGDSVPGSETFPPEALLGRLVSRADERRGISAAALHPGFGAKWSRAVGILLCYCSLARRLALKLHSRRKASAHKFRNPDPAAAMRSAKLRAS